MIERLQMERVGLVPPPVEGSLRKGSSTMKTNMQSTLKRFFPAVGIAMAASLVPTSAAQAEWYYGIGTGLSAQKVKGTQGFNTAAGPVRADVDLNPGDFRDLTKSAFGFGGYATDGTWMIQYSLFYLELEDEVTTPVLASTVGTKINFTNSGGEVTLGYPVHKSESVVVLLDAGLRYTNHAFENTLTISGPVINTQQTREFSNSWTDVLVGASFNVPVAPQWSWNTRLNAGFGGSDGTYTVQTGFTWRFHRSWSAGAAAKYTKVKFENGHEGDSDWYLYDAKESNIGLNVLYNW